MKKLIWLVVLGVIFFIGGQWIGLSLSEGKRSSLDNSAENGSASEVLPGAEAPKVDSQTPPDKSSPTPIKIAAPVAVPGAAKSTTKIAPARAAKAPLQVGRQGAPKNPVPQAGPEHSAPQGADTTPKEGTQGTEPVAPSASPEIPADQ